MPEIYIVMYDIESYIDRSLLCSESVKKKLVIAFIRFIGICRNNRFTDYDSEFVEYNGTLYGGPAFFHAFL